jgi:hypothetical protein
MSRLLGLHNHSREYLGYGRPVLKKVRLVEPFLVPNADHAGSGPAVLRLVIHYLTVNEGELAVP